jgi:hypothetical protein
MNQQKKDGQPGSQFDSGFGGSMFGGGGNTQFGGQQPGQPGQQGNNSQFGAGGGGDFASGFGGTNAVSQIFKEGGFAGDEKKKRMVIFGALAVVVLALGGVYLMFSGDSAEEAMLETPVADGAAAAEGAEGAEAGAEAGAAAEGAAEGAEAAEAGDVAAEDAAEGEDAAMEAAPAEAPAAAVAMTGQSSTYDYNEEMGGPMVQAAAGSTIEVARRADFADAYVIGSVGAAGSFRIPNPPPGKVYWRVQGSQSASEITVNPPPGLGVDFTAPASLSEGTQLSWSASGPVAFFRVEFGTDQAFSSVAHVISTSQTSVGVTGVSAGSYFVRLGGLNRASGKWEYSAATSITVQ